MFSVGESERCVELFKEQGFVRGEKATIFSFFWIKQKGETVWKILLVPLSRTKYYGKVRITKRVGYRLSISTPISKPTRFIITHRRIADYRFIAWLNKRRKYQRVSYSGVEADVFAVNSIDKNWALSLFASGRVLEVLRMIFVNDERVSGHQSLILSPNGLEYSTRLYDVEELSQVSHLVDQLQIVSDEILKCNPPSVTDSETSIERFMRVKPGQSAFILLFGCLIILFLLATIAGAVFYLFS